MSMTTTVQYTDISMSEALADVILEEERPNQVLRNLVNAYSIAGLPTKVLKLNRWNDPGRATAATAGTTFTTTTQLGTAAVSVTPTEAAVFMVIVQDDAIETRVPGMASIAQLMSEGSTEQKVAAMGPEARIAAAACFEKREFDLTSLYSGLSRTAGTTNTILTLADFDQALLTLETGADLPHDDIVACLDKMQVGHLRRDIAITSGGMGGAAWSGDLASIVNLRPDTARNGLKGAVLGVPVYAHGNSVRQVSGNDCLGALFLRGIGGPEMGGGGQAGTFAYVEGRRMQFTVEHDHRERGTELQANWKYAVAERVDLWGVQIASKSTNT